jgi:hypothetical protein
MNVFTLFASKNVMTLISYCVDSKGVIDDAALMLYEQRSD